MTKQEMRRLGLIPYKENTDTSGWMTTRPRRRRRRPPNRTIPEMTIERVEVNIPSRRMRGTWSQVREEPDDTVVSDEAVDHLTQQIDNDILEQMRDASVNEPVEVAELTFPNRPVIPTQNWFARMLNRRRGNGND